jgi:hypothetical protein
MAVNATRTFGAGLSAPQSTARKGKWPNAGGQTDETFVKAEYWLNIGYNVDLDTDEGVVTRFVALPKGIPLDTMAPLVSNSANDEFYMLITAQNNLLADIKEQCKSLQPGETKHFGDLDGLHFQLKRSKAQRQELAPDANPFVRKLTFA